MPPNKNNWVLSIEEEIAKAPIKKIAWGLVALLSIAGIFFVSRSLGIFGISMGESIGRSIATVLIVLFVISFRQIQSPENLDYMAYYLYQIGYEILDFENKNRYLDRNRKYIQNCDEQLSNLMIKFGGVEYFVGDISNFLKKFNDLILRLNKIYSKEEIKDAIIAKLDGESSDKFISEREFISSNLLELANLIHRENKILTSNHVNYLDKLLNELNDIPGKPIHKATSDIPKDIWIKLPYSVKILIFLGIVFAFSFYISSQIMIYYVVTDPYTPAMIVGGSLAAAAFSKIELFITREKLN